MEATSGYRQGWPTKYAVCQAWKELRGGREWTVDADLKDSFDQVNHDILMGLQTALSNAIL